jgi:hypothetical protein
MSARRPDEVLVALSKALADAGVEFALLGGYAVVTWGVPRATFDVDVLIDADEPRLRRALEELERCGFGIDSIYKSGWRDRILDMPLAKAQVFRNGRSISSDLFPVSTPLQRSAFARALKIEVPDAGIVARVITAADLILFKLLADRPKDRLDIQNVLTVQGVPEAAYVREWAERLGVSERWDRALAEARLEGLG